jgi:hypothetical protein
VAREGAASAGEDALLVDRRARAHP